MNKNCARDKKVPISQIHKGKMRSVLKEALLTASYAQRPYIEVYGQVKPGMALYGRVWPCLFVSGRVWPCKVLYSPVWPCMAQYGPV